MFIQQNYYTQGHKNYLTGLTIKLIISSFQGAIILVQERPVDILRQLLLKQRGPDTELVRAYFESQSPEQACATCLILATLESSQNIQVCIQYVIK